MFDSDYSGPWVQYRDLLIRVFLATNRTEFSKYSYIQDITAQLTVRDQSGAESLFTLSLGGFAEGTDYPSQPYIFSPMDIPQRLGFESLNHVLYVTQERLSLEVKLNDVYPDKDSTNNAKSLPPLTFVTSKPMTVLYLPAKLKTATQSTSCATEAGIARDQLRATRLSGFAP